MAMFVTHGLSELTMVESECSVSVKLFVYVYIEGV